MKAQTQDPLPELPGAGLTPNSPLYFLERAAEAIGEFLTFNTEAKARLQAQRALERIAEVKAMLAEKEINLKGLNVALDKLQANVAKAAEIVREQQQKGQDVSKLAKELDTDFEVRERLLKRTLEEKEAKEFLLEQEEEEFELALEIEEEKFELAMEEKERELELKEKELELREEERERAFESKEEEFERLQEERERQLEQQEEEQEKIEHEESEEKEAEEQD